MSKITPAGLDRGPARILAGDVRGSPTAAARAWVLSETARRRQPVFALAIQLAISFFFQKNIQLAIPIHRASEQTFY